MDFECLCGKPMVVSEDLEADAARFLCDCGMCYLYEKRIVNEGEPPTWEIVDQELRMNFGEVVRCLGKVIQMKGKAGVMALLGDPDTKDTAGQLMETIALKSALSKNNEATIASIALMNLMYLKAAWQFRLDNIEQRATKAKEEQEPPTPEEKPE